jgi:hypothetical protein
LISAIIAESISEAAGGVDEDHVVVMPLGVVQRGGGNVGRLLLAGRREKVYPGLGRNGFQLFDGGGAIDVATDGQHLLLLPLLEPLAELGRGGGLAGALQAGHQDHRRRLGGEVEPGTGAAHQFGEFAMDDADQCLAGRQRADHFLAEGLFPDAGGELLDHRQRDVGFEQGHAHFAQHVGNVVFGQSSLAAQVFYDATEPLGKVV